MTQKLPYGGDNRKDSAVNTIATTTTTKKKKKFDPQEEYNTVKNLLRQPKINMESPQSLPGIHTFSRHKKERHDESRPRSRHSPRPSSSSKSSRKRHFRDKEDIVEAELIQKLLKKPNSAYSSSTTSVKKPKMLHEVAPKQEDMTDIFPGEQTQKTLIDTNNNVVPSPQQLFQQQQQQSQIINQSLMQTINSEEWNNPFSFLPRGMGSFANFFTPEQIEILQLLNQRHILEKYQSVAESIGNNKTPPVNTQHENIIEEHGPRSQFYTNLESISNNAK